MRSMARRTTAFAVLLVLIVLTMSASARPAAARPVRCDPPRTRLYVANSFSHDVAVIDAWSGVRTDRIPVRYAPFGLALANDGSRLFIASSRGVFRPGEVVAVSTATNAPLGSVTVGVDPRALAVDRHDRTLYVANAVSGTVQVIDIATMTVRSSVDVGLSYPNALALRPDGRVLYVARRATGDVVGIDTRTGRVTGSPARLPTPDTYSPQAMAMSRDGRTVFLEAWGSVAVVDVATNRVTKAVAVEDGQHMGMAVSPDGTRLAVANFNGSVQEIDLRTGVAGPPIRIPGVVEVIDITYVWPGIALVTGRHREQERGVLAGVAFADNDVSALLPTGGRGATAIVVRHSPAAHTSSPRRRPCGREPAPTDREP
jgi:YVTN family beta-propeller protein